MYQGSNKDNGGIIGTITKGSETIDLEEAAESTSAEEALICQDADGSELAFTAYLDASTGNLSWGQVMSKEQVMRRTVAMSQMTSMMRDLDRNAVYESAIEVCIKSFIAKNNRAPIVLDVGSGTGLLSLLCLKHGAQFVFGIEMFEEMASIAQEVINLNNAEDNILIINAKSTDIDSLPMMPDILVSEILDSALLGESVLSSHADAISRLLSLNENQDISERVIPHSANVFATLVESAEISDMHNIKNLSQLTNNSFVPYRNEYARDCAGGWPLLPIHWKEYEARGGRALSSAVKVLNFNFFTTFDADATPSDSSVDDENAYQFQEGTYDTDVIVTSAGTVHGVILHWKGQLLSPSLDPFAKHTYSTEPLKQNWQDHWQQTVFPLVEAIEVNKGDVIRLTVAHNSIRIWLAAALHSKAEPDSDNEGDAAGLEEYSSELPHGELSEDREHSLNLTNIEEESSDFQQENTLRLARKRVKIDANLELHNRNNKNNNNSNINQNVDINQNNSSSTQKSISFGGKSFGKSNNSTELPAVQTQVLQFASHMSSRDCNHRLQPKECSCGWHLLCGSDRIAMMNNMENRAIWDNAIYLMLNRLYELGLLTQPLTNSDSSNDDSAVAVTKQYNIILDMADGSLNAISAALELKKTSQNIDNLTVKVVSKESKFFSHLFFSQLIQVNEIENYLSLWDGNNLADIASNLDEEIEVENEEEMESTENDGESVANSSSAAALSTSTIQIVSLISECFNYQMTTMPTWQAISFAYQRSALSNYLHPQAVVMPQQAYIMCAAFESDQLHTCHGNAGIVSGFDHAPLDTRQSDWFIHAYPYKLANYKKKLLTAPMRIAALNYNNVLESQPVAFNQTQFIASGRCDFIAIWVDYQLTLDQNSTLVAFKNGDFPSYMKVNLKFFEHSQQVNANNVLNISTAFVVGDSDFKFEFQIN